MMGEEKHGSRTFGTPFVVLSVIIVGCVLFGLVSFGVL